MLESFKGYLDIQLLSSEEYQITVAQLLLIPVVICIGYLFVKWMVNITTERMKKRNINPDVIQVVRRAVFILGLIILFVTALDLLHVPLTAFAFVSGAIAIGVGFGAQNIINNFISGWILMWERPIRINDYIEIADATGTVEEINTRSTRIRRVDGVHLLVPNSKLLEETVVNWTLVDKLLRSIVRVGVAYGSDVEKVRDVLEKVLKGHQEVLTDPRPQIIFEDFGDSSLAFDVYFWVNSDGEKSARMVRSEIRFAIERHFRANDITIAFPQRDIHIDGAIKIERSH